MKKSINYFLSLALFFGSVNAFSQNDFTFHEEEIIGSWLMDGPKTFSKMDNTDIEAIESHSQIDRDILVRSLELRKYVFMKDGGFHASWGIEGNVFSKTGNWKINADKLSLTLDGISNEYLIKEFSRKSLVLQPLAKKRGMIKVLVLYKNN